MAHDYVHVLYDRLQLAPNEFRLLRLRHFSDEGVLSCSLSKHDVFAKDLSYFAVSYTWGSQPSDHCMECNGIEMKVTRGCFDALSAIKSKFGSHQLVWIDQLCIDQNSLHERGSQVFLMSNIYAGAQQVLIWLDEFENLTCGLGHEPDFRDGQRQSKSSFEELQRSAGIKKDLRRSVTLQQEAKSTKALIEYLCKYYSRHTRQDFGTAECPASNIPTSIQAWDRFLAILRHRYFERRWILQETCKNASRVFIMLETELLPINSLNHSSLQLQLIEQGYCNDFDKLLSPEVKANVRDPASNSMDLGVMFSIMRDIELEGAIGLLSLLWKCDTFETTDPLDRVYALRALTADEDVPYPDYTLTTEQLLLTLARSFVSKGQAADILAHAGLVHHDGYTDVPSWCPTWEVAGDADYLNGVYRKEDFRAAGKTTPQVSFVDTNEELLKVHGAVVDTVVSVTAGATIGRKGMPSGIHQQAVQTLRASAPQQTMSSAEFTWFLATTRQNIDHDPPRGRFQVSHSFAIESLLRTLLSPHMPVESLQISKESEHSRLWKLLFDLQWSRWLGQRCFCVTSKGFVGIAPWPGVKSGDLVAILAGVNVPIILRPNPDREGTFQIVSDSYFMGLGKGEAMENGLYAENERDFILS